MNTKEKDDKKIAIVKNGKKAQIIINPPEIQNPVPYRENFSRALQKHRVAIEEKVQIILNAKASQCDFPASVLEQVYVRGVKSLPVNSNLTREQHAMNRVNSFLSGGAAMKQDMDLIPIHERIVTKQLKGTGGGARPHIKREKSPYNNKILYHVVDAKGRIKHTTSDEMSARRHLIQKYQAYLEGVESPMKRFEGTKNLTKTYKDDTPGEESIKKEGDGLWANIHAKRARIKAGSGERMRKPGSKGAPTPAQLAAAAEEVVREEKMKGEDPCWKGYHMVGKKIKAGREVPNCVPKNEEVDIVEYGDTAAQRFRRANPDEPDEPSYNTKRYSSYRAPEKQEPHAVHINGKKWKTFGSQRHAQNVANKIKGATVHKEEVEQVNELSSELMRKAVDKYQDKINKSKYPTETDDLLDKQARMSGQARRNELGKRYKDGGLAARKEEVEIDEAKKFGYDAINARFKKQTGQSLEDRAKHYAATSERLKKMQANYEAQNKKKDNVTEAKTPAWSRKEGKNPEGGLNRKGIASYRAQNPGSKLSMAVTTEPSKLKKDSKSWKRRKSFCARMSGVDGPMKKPNGEPTRKALALRKWNC